MLRHYLPVPPRASGVDPLLGDTLTDDVLEQVRKAVQLRNNLVHKGQANIEFRWLYKWLDLCRELLYLFDVYQGYAWALGEIQWPPGHLGELLYLKDGSSG